MSILADQISLDREKPTLVKYTLPFVCEDIDREYAHAGKQQ